MKLEGWFVEAFGQFQRYEVRGLTGGLTVIAGPNESGKSTLLAFLRGVLFGFPDRRSREPQYSPAGGGPAGGRVFLDGPEGLCTVERWAGRRHSLRVTLSGGQEAAAADLARWLGGADETLFRNVFAFSLAELQTLQTLQVDEVRDRIYSAHVTGAGQSARGAVRQLEAEMTALLRPRGASRIGELAQRVAQLEEICRDARAHAAEYPKLLETEAALRDEARAASQELEEAAQEARWYGALLELWPLWQERERARQAPAPPSSADGLREALAALAGQQRALEQELARTRAAAAALEDPERAAVLERLAEADQLAARLPLYEEQRRQLADWRTKEAACAEQVARVLERLGPEWSEPRVAAFDPPPDWIDQARAWAASLAADWRDIQERRANWERAAAERERLEQALAQETPAPHAADREVLVNLQGKLAALAAEERAAEALRAAAPIEGQTPGPPRWALGLVVVAVFALVGVGGWLSTVSAAAGGFVILLALALLAAFFVKSTATQRAESAGEDAALAAAEQRMAALKSALAEEGARAGLAPGFTLEDVEDRLREALGQEEAPLRRQLLEATLADAREHEQAQKDAYEAAEAAFAEHRQGWVFWRQQSELPESLTPENAGVLLADLQLAHSLVRARQEAAARVAQLEKDVLAWEQSLRAWGEPAGTDPDGREALAAWRQRIAEAQRQESRREELLLAAAALERRLEDTRQEAARLELAAARDAGADADAVRAFEERQADLLARLTGLGDRAAVDAALSAGDPAVWEQRARAAAETAERLRARRDDAIGRLRLTEERRQQLEESGEVAVCESQLAFARAELARATRQWLVASLAAGLITETLAEYTRTRQPEVLREASAAFARITDGMYLRVAQDEDGPSLVVEDCRGRWWKPEQLSRGAAEQLFLALRFGLATEFARHGVPLPVVMDDVLVNFDPERARATAAEIARFARSTEPERQVLFFTCHPETVRLLEEAYPGARRIELARAAALAAS